MQDFTPLSGLVDGLLIGLAVALMLLMNGRVAGISGIVGGLLFLRAGVAGFGTRLGSGCTSGHGLCGVERLSRRSVVATATFFGVAMLTVFLTGHVF
jgi:uncharacterized membrane protein YedE/YeeE